MELEFAILATAAEASGTKLHLLGAGFDTLTVSELPVKLTPFSLALRLSESDEERSDSQHVLKVDVVRPDGGISQVTPEPFPFKFNAPKQGRRGRFAVILQIVATFELAGRYEIQLRCDDQLLKTLELFIVHSPISDHGVEE
jgi:hypothetical protein